MDLVEARARAMHQMRMRRGDGVVAAVAAVPLAPTTTTMQIPAAQTTTLPLGGILKEIKTCAVDFQPSIMGGIFFRTQI